MISSWKILLYHGSFSTLWHVWCALRRCCLRCCGVGDDAACVRTIWYAACKVGCISLFIKIVTLLRVLRLRREQISFEGDQLSSTTEAKLFKHQWNRERASRTIRGTSKLFVHSPTCAAAHVCLRTYRNLRCNARLCGRKLSSRDPDGV